MVTLRIGRNTSEFVEIRFAVPTQATSGDAWVDVDAAIAVEGFRGEITAMFEVTDFLRFGAQLAKVYESLSGQAVLDSRERQLFLRVTGNGRGNIVVDGYAYTHASYGNKLEFEINLDQTFLVEPIEALRQLAVAWEKVVA